MLTIDEYGLPLGEERETVLEQLLSGLANNGENASNYLHVAFTQSGEFEELTEFHVKSSTIVGDPFAALWGYTIPANISLIVVDHRGDTDAVDDPTVLVGLTKMGDTATLIKEPDGGENYYSHGELNFSEETDALVNVMRRCLGLVVDTDDTKAGGLLATWIINEVAKTINEFKNQINRSLTEEEEKTITMTVCATATARILLDYPYLTYGPDLQHYLNKQVNKPNLELLNEKEFDTFLKTSAELNETLTWLNLVDTEMVRLLPNELRNKENVEWAGEGMCSWWVFNTHIKHPQFALTELDKTTTYAGQTCKEWLIATGFLN